MQSFNVGDTVRCPSGRVWNGNYVSELTSLVGTVQHGPDSDGDYGVSWAGYGYAAHNPHQLQLAAAVSRPFQAGDKVVCPSEQRSYGGQMTDFEWYSPTMVGSVVKGPDFDGDYLVEWPRGAEGGARIYHKREHLQLAETARQFQVGDRVRCPSGLRWDGRPVVGFQPTEGTVERGPDSGGDYVVRWDGGGSASHKPEQLQLVEPAPATEPLTQAQRAEVEGLMVLNQKIKAIQLLRSFTGWGLKEAKDFVEAMPLPAPHQEPEAITEMRGRIGDRTNGLERSFTKALLADELFREWLFDWTGAANSRVRSALKDLFDGDGLYSSEVDEMLAVYDRLHRPAVNLEAVRQLADLRAQRERQAQALQMTQRELESLDRQMAELQEKLAA